MCIWNNNTMFNTYIYVFDRFILQSGHVLMEPYMLHGLSVRLGTYRITES